MSTIIISDLSVLEELNNQELKVVGAASSASAAAADRNDAVSASAATTNGYANANASGGYSYFDPWYGGYSESGPSASANASDRYYYYW